MESLKRKSWVKLTAAMLFAVFTCIAVFSSAGVIILGAVYGIYDDSQKTFEKRIVESDMYDAANDFANDNIYENEGGKVVVEGDEYGQERGYRFKVLDSKDKVVYNSYDGKQACIVVSDAYHIYEYSRVKVYAVENPEDGTREAAMLKFADKTYENRYLMAWASITGIVTSIILFGFLMTAAGRREGDKKIHPRAIDRRFADIYTVIAWTAIICLGICALSMFDDAGIAAALMISAIIGYVMWMLFIAWAMSMAVQIKSHTLFKNCALAYLLRFTGRIIKNIPSMWRIMTVTGIVLILNLVLVSMCADSAEIALIFIIEAIAFFLLIGYETMNIDILNKAAERLAAGKIGEKVDVAKMTGGLKRHGENLNSIDEAVRLAVDEQMRSEKMKTELITNVSHDIKTPLTSIINYSQLLKGELEDKDMENAREYADVIYGQSLRLKKLASDIVEYSKISTGNLEVEPRRLDLGMLVSQGLGEYEEKFAENELTPIAGSIGGTFIYADGKLMWRVLDNIFGNICKYAQPGTRVYIDVTEEEGKVKAVFKNISKYELNISANELRERFVRGDSSRNTEGSGLGLSIATDLVHLQGGNITLSIDGDLFKTEITFDRSEDVME